MRAKIYQTMLRPSPPGVDSECSGEAPSYQYERSLWMNQYSDGLIYEHPGPNPTAKQAIQGETTFTRDPHSLCE